MVQLGKSQGFFAEAIASRLIGQNVGGQHLGYSLGVFTSEDGLRPLSIFTLDDQHARTRRVLKLGKDFVVHSLRHTFGTRMGEAGADAFEIKQLMGHSSVTVSQRYVHPSPESLERAFVRLESMNEKAARRLPEGAKVQLVPTKFPTPEGESERYVS